MSPRVGWFQRVVALAWVSVISIVRGSGSVHSVAADFISVSVDHATGIRVLTM